MSLAASCGQDALPVINVPAPQHSHLASRREAGQAAHTGAVRNHLSRRSRVRAPRDRCSIWPDVDLRESGHLGPQVLELEGCPNHASHILSFGISLPTAPTAWRTSLTCLGGRAGQHEEACTHQQPHSVLLTRVWIAICGKHETSSANEQEK